MGGVVREGAPAGAALAGFLTVPPECQNLPMAITEGPTTAARENAYRQAAGVVAGLEPAVASFAQKLKDCGKWPMTPRGEAGTPVPDTLHTGGHPHGRHLSIYHDGTWLVHDLIPGAGHEPVMVAKCAPGKQPEFITPLLAEPTDADLRHTLEHPQFEAYMDAVARAPQWIPAELARYLSGHGIPAPR